MKRFLVSGVTSGIGKAVAALLRREGHQVIPILRQAEQHTGDHERILLDYAYPERVEAAFAALTAPVHAFINCAGLLPGKSFHEVDLATLQATFNINVITPMRILQAINAHIADGGSIILFGSISGSKGSYDDGYAAAKGGVHTLVKSLALKFAPRDIRVIGVAPGITKDTRMTDELIAGRYEHNINLVPLKRPSEPHEVADLVYFLCSPSAHSMTGCLVDINGGQYLR